MESNTIYSKLAKARVMLQQSNLKKSGFNNYGKYYYFELSDFLPRVNEIFNELGLFSQFYIDIDTTPDNQVVEMAHLKIYNANNIADDCIDFKSTTASADIKGATPIQMLGGKHTYMRRYLWLACMEIVENDSQDAQDTTNNTNYQAKRNSLTSNKKITANQKALIESVYKNENLTKLLEINNLKSLDDMSMTKADEIIIKLKEKAGNNNA